MLNVHVLWFLMSSDVGRHIREASTETIKFIRDGERVGKGGWRWGKRENIYLSLYTVTITMIPALRWAAMRAILMFQ